MPRSVRRLVAATVLALALSAGAAGVAPGAARAASTETPAPVVVAPVEGSHLEPGAVELAWAPVDGAAGYEVRWTADLGGDPVEGLEPVPGGTSLSLAAEEGASYTWQVRALPDGAWSSPGTFYVDLQLPTLGLPEQPAATGGTTGRGGPDGVPGEVWIAIALGFSAVLLVAVFVQSRTRREQDA